MLAFSQFSFLFFSSFLTKVGITCRRDVTCSAAGEAVQVSAAAGGQRLANCHSAFGIDIRIHDGRGCARGDEGNHYKSLRLPLTSTSPERGVVAHVRAVHPCRRHGTGNCSGGRSQGSERIYLLRLLLCLLSSSGAWLCLLISLKRAPPCIWCQRSAARTDE